VYSLKHKPTETQHMWTKADINIFFVYLFFIIQMLFGCCRRSVMIRCAIWRGQYTRPNKFF